MIAAVLGPIAARTAAGWRQKCRGGMSTNTGVAPASATALAVAAKLNDGTMTSSPGPIPMAERPSSSALVPELTATQGLPSTTSANSASNAATSGPCAIIPEASTRSTAARSSAPMSTPVAEMDSDLTQLTSFLDEPFAGARALPHRLGVLLQPRPRAPDPSDLTRGRAHDQREVGHVPNDD